MNQSAKATIFRIGSIFLRRSSNSILETNQVVFLFDSINSITASSTMSLIRLNEMANASDVSDVDENSFAKVNLPKKLQRIAKLFKSI